MSAPLGRLAKTTEARQITGTQRGSVAGTDAACGRCHGGTRITVSFAEGVERSAAVSKTRLNASDHLVRVTTVHQAAAIVGVGTPAVGLAPRNTPRTGRNGQTPCVRSFIMRVFVTGATGFIGSAASFSRSRPHRQPVLLRSERASPR